MRLCAIGVPEHQLYALLIFSAFYPMGNIISEKTFVIQPLSYRLPSIYFTRSIVPTSRNVEKIIDRKSTRLNSSHANISYAVFCLKKKNTHHDHYRVDVL